MLLLAGPNRTILRSERGRTSTGVVLSTASHHIGPYPKPKPIPNHNLIPNPNPNQFTSSGSMRSDAASTNSDAVISTTASSVRLVHDHFGSYHFGT